MTEEQLKENLKSRFWRLNNLYWIMDDHGNKIKFRLNAVQYALYRAFWWLNIILKSRQHGITTFICLFMLDACLFGTNIRAGLIAHKLDAAKMIFRDKVKYAYSNLPDTITSRIICLKDDAMELVFNNNSSFYVSTSMRSGTLQYLHVSEYSWICQHAPLRAKEIKAGALETIHEGGYAVFECTAEGVGDDFQKMCTIGQEKKRNKVKLTRMDFAFHFFPWYQKPENQLFEPVEIPDFLIEYFERIETETGHSIGAGYRAWYTKKKETLGDMIYKEHPSTPDEAFYSSVEGAYLARYMVSAHEQNRIIELPIEDTALTWCCWDLGDMHTAIWFFQIKEEGWINWVDYYYDNRGLGLHEYSKLLDTKRYIYGKDHFVGPDILTSNAKKSGETVIDLAARVGINFTPVDPHLVIDRITAMKSILNRSRFNKYMCADGVKALSNYRKEKNETASTEEIAVYREKPLHDWASHGADAFGHGCLAILKGKIDGMVLGRSAKPVISLPNYEDYGESDEFMRA